MPWEKSSDTAAMHPLVMGITAQPLGKPPRAADLRLNAVYGFVHRCSNWSAAQETDYGVPLGTVQALGGPGWEWLLEQAVGAGLMKPTRRRRDPSWKITEDPGLFHIQSRESRAWRNARDRDIANPALRNPVRFRDGDACRYCQRIVQWSDRKSDIKGEYDHRPAGKPAKSIDNMYVSCRSCNSKRGDLPLAEADARYPPYPAPAAPFYGPHTRALLAKAGYDLPPPGTHEQFTSGARPGTQPDHATPSRPSQTRPRPQRSTGTPAASSSLPQPQSRETASEEHADPHQRDADPPRTRRTRRAPRGGRSAGQPP